jgi:O-antigen/teichoic acid export membrane protein
MLSIANLFSCIAAFFGTTYVVTKQSKKAFSTTIIGAVANIALTLMLVPLLGIMGAATATAASYALMAVVRYRDTRKIVKIVFDKKEMVPSLIVVAVQVGISLFPYSPNLLIADFVLSAVLIVVLHRGLLGIVKRGRSVVRARGKAR